MLTTFSGREASQNEYELRSFIALLNRYGVRSYLEIGSREGDTFVEVMQSLPPKSKGVAVDLPGGLWGKHTTRAKLETAVRFLRSQNYNASFVFGDSQTDATAKLVIGRGPYDAVLIDGDHTLVGVSKDFDLYGSLAPIVAFHDIVGHGQMEKVHGNLVEVPILWDSFKRNEKITERYNLHEFIDDGSKMGIGVLVRKDLDNE